MYLPWALLSFFKFWIPDISLSILIYCLCSLFPLLLELWKQLMSDLFTLSFISHSGVFLLAYILVHKSFISCVESAVKPIHEFLIIMIFSSIISFFFLIFIVLFLVVSNAFPKLFYRLSSQYQSPCRSIFVLYCFYWFQLMACCLFRCHTIFDCFLDIGFEQILHKMF